MARYFASEIFFLIASFFVCGCCAVTAANGQTYKELPPAGIVLPDKSLEALQRDTKKIRDSLNLAVGLSQDSDSWRADVEVFVRAVELAIEQNLFYKPTDAEAAAKALSIASDRLNAAKAGKRGLDLIAIGSSGKDQARTLAGGFVSDIDGSVQPYGLVIPTTSFDVGGKNVRMDVWLHGRGETNTEVPFLLDRLDKIGEYAPPGVVVMHPFGRHCTAFKFAGETDVYEAIEHAKDLLPIDPNRISIRGFSMGGAGCWHLAAHDPGRWFAANPGAGFVDTMVYQGWEKTPPYEPSDWGRRLLLWYDVSPWVDNLSNTQVVAYSGELDPQRAAAEAMVAAAKASKRLTADGFEITHIIGKGMGHKIDDASAAMINARLVQLEAEVGKQPRTKIHLVTHTLRYHQIDWLSVEGMEEHWRQARVDAEIEAPATIRITTENVSSLQLNFADAGWPMKSGYLQVLIDDQELDGPAVMNGKPSLTQWSKVEGQWQEVDTTEDVAIPGLRKVPGLQGPIDDAFMSSFLFVLPSRPCRHGVVQRFVDREIEHARQTWRRIMRGEDRVVMDIDLTPEQIASYNLVCFGDFNSNRFLASIAPGLPIQWTDTKIVVGEQTFDPSRHAPLFVYPNPQAPDHYVVVNSGITFRQFSNNSNARQIAMLPDWAIVDVNQPSDQIFPGRVVAADFFNESWQLSSFAPRR